MYLYLFCFLAFCLGSIPTGYLAVKMLKGVDIRDYGSGNVGATNAMRVLGRGPGYAVFAIDFLKGAVPVWLFKSIPAGQFADSTTVLLLGLCALLGHVFSPFLRFKGGKGVATGAGVLAAGFPVLFLITMAAWTVAFLGTKIVSVSSLGSVLALVIASIVLGYHAKTVAVFSAVAGFIFWTHRSNIARLMKGEEGKPVNKQN